MLNIENTYTWMVLTEAWCGDCAQNLPVIDEIVKLNPQKIKLCIALRDENPGLMNNYLTKGARAIPTLIASDETLGKEVFAWGPPPAPTQEMLYSWKKNPDGISWDKCEKNLHSWYANDKTKTMQAEFIKVSRELNNFSKDCQVFDIVSS